jgi:hypothetical protein
MGPFRDSTYHQLKDMTVFIQEKKDSLQSDIILLKDKILNHIVIISLHFVHSCKPFSFAFSRRNKRRSRHTLDLYRKTQRRFLECGVCTEIYNEDERVPRLLPCLHTFYFT